MPSAKKTEDGASPSKDAEIRNVYVLKKNHGITRHGRTAHFYEAGAEFDLEKDAVTIAALMQSGAILEHV